MYNHIITLEEHSFDYDINTIEISECGDRLIVTFDSLIVEIYMISERGTLLVY